MQKIIDIYRKNEVKNMKKRMKELKELLVVFTLKTTIALTICGAFVGACGCAESFGDCSEYTTKKVLYLEDFCKDAEGTTYNVDADDYKYGDVISITLNPHGRVVGVNGKCLVQTLE